MSLQVRALGVDFAAAWVSAAMHTLVSLWLGVVVHCIHQLIRTELRPHGPRHHMRELLDGRGGT